MAYEKKSVMPCFNLFKSSFVNIRINELRIMLLATLAYYVKISMKHKKYKQVLISSYL